MSSDLDIYYYRTLKYLNEAIEAELKMYGVFFPELVDYSRAAKRMCDRLARDVIDGHRKVMKTTPKQEERLF
jgi:hypothetical protein